MKYLLDLPHFALGLSKQNLVSMGFYLKLEVFQIFEFRKT